MPQRVIPDDNTREDFPLFDGLLAYFPAALCEISRWSKVGNIKHNGPTSPLHWSREKSTDHQNKIARHLLDYDQVEESGFLEAVPLAWRALALLQTELEKKGWAEGRNAEWKKVASPEHTYTFERTATAGVWQAVPVAMSVPPDVVRANDRTCVNIPKACKCATK